MEPFESLSNSTNGSNHLNQSKNKNKGAKEFDGTVVASQFIEYFYKTWLANPNNFITDDIIKSYSAVKYNSNLYKGSAFIQLLLTFVSENLGFENCKYEIVDSGSRQIYILVTGQIKNNLVTKTFSQSFMIAYAGEQLKHSLCATTNSYGLVEQLKHKKSSHKWTLINSILIIN